MSKMDMNECVNGYTRFKRWQRQEGEPTTIRNDWLDVGKLDKGQAKDV